LETIHYEAGNLEKARSFAYSRYQMLRSGAPDLVAVVSALKQVAVVDLALNDVDSATAVVKRAVEAARDSGRQEALADAIESEALLAAHQRQWSTATRMFSDAMAVVPKDSARHAELQAGLGWTLATGGHFIEAEQAFGEVSVTREKVLNGEHPLLAKALVSRGLACMLQKKYAEAEPLFERALHIFERSVGDKHRDVLEVLTVLAMAGFATGGFTKAEPLLQRALAMQSSHAKRWDPAEPGSPARPGPLSETMRILAVVTPARVGEMSASIIKFTEHLMARWSRPR
jgi:tetratricopeptide (TPR) repeat protein